MNYRDTVGFERETIPAMNAAPTAADSLVALCKAILERLGATPADPDDSLLTVAGQRDAAATADTMADITSTDLSAKVRLTLNRLSTDAFTATINGSARTELDVMAAQLAVYFAVGGAAIASTVDPGGTERASLELILEDLGKILAGGGITTFPAAANPGNGVSMAAVLRAVITSLVGGDDLDSWTNINNTANASLNAALQNFAFMFGATGVNSFNPTIQGAARADLDIALAQLAIYFATGGAAIAATVDPGGTERATLELILEDIGKILAGGGITTYPAASAPGNGISLAAAVRKIYDLIFYAESSASGETVAGYVNAIDLDNRGVKNTKIVVKNTDDTNSLYYKVTVKHADYTAGTDDIVVAETSIALGDEDVVALNEAYSRVTVAVKNNAGAAGYTVSYLQNR